MRRVFSWLALALFAVLAVLPGTAGAAGKSKVYVLHVDQFQEIDPFVANLTDRVFDAAESDPDAAGVAIIINTPGGLVTSAFQMQERILDSKLKTVAFVEGKALSAGALIATAAERIYMHTGGIIGAAEPRVSGSTEPADPKTLSAVVAAFESTALARGRDPAIARAMVDRKKPIPGQQSELLTLNYRDAIDKRYADGQAQSLAESIKLAGISDYELVDIPLTLSDRVGRFLTTPWVATLLLVAGVVAIGIEFIKPGVTLPGLIGILCLGLFFMGNVLAGTANWVELSLALLGIVLLIVEAFVPGFGIFGVSGIISMAASIFFAVPDTTLALWYLTFASVAFAFVLFAVVRMVSKKGLGKALTLASDARGWVPERADLTGLVGKEGNTVTVLRPAGTAQFGQEKVDVVSEGEFLPAGTRVAVVRVEGTRVLVRPVGQ